MIKFYDPSGVSHFGQASITRTTSVNGGLSLTGEVFAGDDVLNGLDYGWWLNFDNEKYVITYKKLSDDTNTIVFDAVQQFFWDFAKVALHSQYTGSHEYAFYLNQLFNGSGYTYKNDVTIPAFEKENWGYKNKLSLFNDIMDQVDVEFEVHNETVHIAKQIGSDLTSFVRKGINLSDLTEEIKISDFATYAKGYGAFKDQQDPSQGRLEVEYRSELADKFGVLEMDPIVDERYTIADNLIAELKNKVDATYTVSMTMNIYDLESAGYPNYESPKVGDWILAIDEALNFKRKIRIIKLEEKFDVTGKRIGYTATCGDLSIVDQYTNLQGSLDSKVQRIQENIDSVAASANGKNSNYYGTKEPVNANEGDLWFDQSNSDPDKWTIKQWSNGRWEQLTLNPGEVSAKVEVARKEAEKAVNNAESAADKADQLATKYDDTNSLASQALDRATSAQSEAGSAIAKAESTASEFGNVSQKADSAFDNAMNAQSAASTAVMQASSAAADSKDAKQIAGAVSQSYKTLTDGSTMTIAELQSGLAAKLTKADLDGYATQTWAQNQIQVSADGINGTMSSIKSTVDSQTTIINDLKADSSSFKSQFTTVNDTLGKQTTDISTLQASSKELSSNFSSLNTDINGKLTTLQGNFDLSSKQMSITMSKVSDKVDNMQIGGRNLIHDTSFERGIWHNILNKPTMSITSDGNLKFTIPDTNQAGVGVTSESLKMGIYTLTAKVRGHGLLQPYVMYRGIGNYALYGSNGVPDPMINSDTDFVDIKYTFTLKGKDPAKQYAFAILTIAAAGNWLEIKKDSLKLESGNTPTDWSPATKDLATVTALSSLSQTVDGMKADISKKIESKDLNGYATETWAQNQIKTTADGINGTLSSVKNTVDSHDTSINELKADSSSFKSQFTTVNDTLGKQTTDISTLQASSKSLSANFDSLSSDNQTNQHDIGQLQASAKTFNSTLMTVQQQVTDSAVGTNLFSQSAATGGYVNRETGDINSPSTTFNENVSEYIPAMASSNYTIQMWGTTPSGSYSWYGIGLYDSDKNFISRQEAVGITQTSDTEEHISKTLTTTSATAYVRLSFRKYNNYKIKLEKGSIATDYSVNPEDTATVTTVSSISQTIDKIQGTVANKADKSQITQLSGQITSVVGSSGQQNLVYNSDFRINTDGWQKTGNGTNTGNYLYWSQHSNDSHNGSYALVIDSRGSTDQWVGWSSNKRIKVTPGYSVSLGVWVKMLSTGGSVAIEYNFYPDKTSGRTTWAQAWADTSLYGTWQRVISEDIKVPDGQNYMSISFFNQTQAFAAFSQPMVTIASTLGSYSPDSANQSQIAQLKDDISFKVSKDGVVNAVNISTEGIQIYGDKLHITATTYIDDAIIKDAMIESINADKITVGTLDADKIQVIHLNADNITTGTIKGTNLEIGLNTGNVEFQKGRIHSADNTIDINIDSKYISVADNNNRVFISGGQIQMIKPTVFSQQATPYVRISNEGAGASLGGATFWARDYFAITHQFNDGNLFSTPMGTEGFSGISGGQSSSGWQVTKVGGAERGVFISGGKQINTGAMSFSPFIRVGDDGSSGSGSKGSNITMKGDYIYLRSPHTTSSGANAYIGPDGVLLPSTSAAKYKTNIVRSFETEMGNKLLEVPVAHWNDKEEVLAKTVDPNAKDPKTYFGMIADDLDDAGLNELVEYDDKGVVRGIQYDRVALSLIPLIRDYRNRIIELETKVEKMKEV